MSDDRTGKAVNRLAEALHELAYRGRISINPDIRMLLCPGKARLEDTDARHLHAIGFSADVVELLADAVEQLLTAHTAAGQVDPHGPAQFAATNPELAADIASAFTGIDLTALTRTVLDDTAPEHRMAVTRALDSMFSDADEEAEDDE